MYCHTIKSPSTCITTCSSISCATGAGVIGGCKRREERELVVLTPSAVLDNNRAGPVPKDRCDEQLQFVRLGKLWYSNLRPASPPAAGKQIDSSSLILSSAVGRVPPIVKRLLYDAIESLQKCESWSIYFQYSICSVNREWQKADCELKVNLLLLDVRLGLRIS
jgi:hypothetical protein